MGDKCCLPSYFTVNNMTDIDATSQLHLLLSGIANISLPLWFGCVPQRPYTGNCNHNATVLSSGIFIMQLDPMSYICEWINAVMVGVICYESQYFFPSLPISSSNSFFFSPLSRSPLPSPLPSSLLSFFLSSLPLSPSSLLPITQAFITFHLLPVYDAGGSS